jgi:starvation-inducible DNA-binding protein
MYQTKNDLPAHTRADVIVILNARLAESIDLMHQAKQAHWNVKGPSFIALHKLFDEVVDVAEEYMDLLAERVVQLGGAAEGTIQEATTRTGLKAYPLTLAEERDHVEALSSALAVYGTSVRQAIDQTDALGGPFRLPCAALRQSCQSLPRHFFAKPGICSIDNILTLQALARFLRPACRSLFSGSSALRCFQGGRLHLLCG